MSNMLTGPSGLAFLQAVEDRKDAAVVASGFAREDDDGNEVPDYTALRQAGALVLAKAVVDDRDDRARIGLSAHDLYATVMPEAPGADGSTPDDLVDVEVKKVLVRFLW